MWCNNTLDFYKGDISTLYCEFKKDDKVVQVKNPKVRVLHEYNDNVYEDLPWKPMESFDDGYAYNFDTNVCENYGKYVIVFSGEYNEEQLNILDSFNIIARNTEDNNTIYLYGFVNDINSNRIIKDVKVKIVDLENNNIVYQTTTDEDGKWESKIFPSDYEFIFSLDGYEERTVRAQIGDENEEIQFNNIGLEKKSDASLGTGIFKIEDEFTSKNHMGISNISIFIFTMNDLKNPFIQTSTDDKGKWKVFLDNGNYIMKISLPSGVEKKFQLNVYNDGSKTIEEIKTKSTQIVNKVLDNGHGTEELTDYILDAHGNGIQNALVQAYKYNPTLDDYELECQDNTTLEGQFNLNLNKGKYKLVITCDGFQKNTQVIDV